MGTREAVFVGDGSTRLVDWVLYPNKQYRRSDGTTTTFTTNANSVVTIGILIMLSILRSMVRHHPMKYLPEMGQLLEELLEAIIPVVTYG
ncbi:PF07588 domain protein [Leptospira interrogans str. UT126]|nr:PF07588 domain protein [Leptospira interrogans str. UT126]